MMTTTRHFVVWGPYFNDVDEALDHFHSKGSPLKVVLDVSVSGHITGGVELAAAPAAPRIEEGGDDVEVS